MPLHINEINADLEYLRGYYYSNRTGVTTTNLASTSDKYFSSSAFVSSQAMEELFRRQREEIESITLSPGLYKTGPYRFRGYGPRSNLFILRDFFSLARGNWYCVEFFYEWGELAPTLTSREMEIMRSFLKAKAELYPSLIYEVEPIPDLREML